ncbi:hypothetical protein K1T71_000056 [Dendrolimus kikuchii]|uniref:Uncharacterized protein n=1 Tax=Dendrolimus kikuchii TaxID=765133 RepID=A0ACC1DI43_9NEOP|nr:hypothetical protein K1T71_000056 [Dendrolimus kikuchii]
MNTFKSAITRGKHVLTQIRPPVRVQMLKHHDGPPQPFENMPFSIPNRYAATLFFSVFFGIGLYAPFIILWYSMAKRTL